MFEEIKYCKTAQLLQPNVTYEAVTANCSSAVDDDGPCSASSHQWVVSIK